MKSILKLPDDFDAYDLVNDPLTYVAILFPIIYERVGELNKLYLTGDDVS